MSKNTQELDEILDHLMQYSFDYGRGTIPISENPPLIEARKAKQAILDWHNKQVENTVTIIEDWNEREGRIYYRWKITNAEDWNEKLTPYKEKPVVQLKTLSHREFEEFYDNQQKETLMKQANTTSEEELREKVDALLDNYFRPHHDYIYNANSTNDFLDAAMQLIQKEVEKAKIEARIDEHTMVRDEWSSPGISYLKTKWSITI